MWRSDSPSAPERSARSRSPVTSSHHRDSSCRGAWAGREHCVPAKWPVDHTQVFERAAPYAYSYAFDDSATMSCKHECYYRVTFGTTNDT
ncbi:thaumatin family protein [Streptomyces longwoodensis]|uniref:thaumatin family protein n=1 Tax=Streptomyces longwoodensis TaxID=68231 RepID=UPI0033EE91E0